VVTAQELYDAVRPLWERDAGFKVPGLAYSDGAVPNAAPFPAAWFLSPPAVKKDNEYCTDTLMPEAAAALIRDRIMERLGELGWEVEQVLLKQGEWYVTCRAYLPQRQGSTVGGHSYDRTLALIEAALQATA
jgi:hypothetical protein